MTSTRAWRQLKCVDCSGHGLVSGYTADGSDFTGAEECRTCAGSGSLWASAKGALAQYPGGPFCGRTTAPRNKALSKEGAHGEGE
jgi:hypothetical protein